LVSSLKFIASATAGSGAAVTSTRARASARMTSSRLA
jgi:hypothetical protein